MSIERDAVLIFHGVHRVLKAEKALKAAGFDLRLMPVPRQLSSDCGLSIAIFLRDREAVEEVLARAASHYAELYALEGGEYRKLG